MTTITNSQGNQVQVYASRADAIHFEIILQIEAGDATADEYDIDAIAEEVLEWHDEEILDSEGKPAVWLPASGYCSSLAADDDYTFWAAVEAYKL